MTYSRRLRCLDHTSEAGRGLVWTVALAAAVTGAVTGLDAHGLSGRDARLLQGIDGPAVGPLLYLGAKHMVTGLDHVLFLAGVIFLLYRPRHVILYASLFTLGHSLTLLAGALGGWRLNPYGVDAIIGGSVVYKAFENMGGWRRVGWAPDTRVVIWIFGLCHGVGLASRLNDLALPSRGLVINILSFNVGVEIGQALALAALMTLLGWWRTASSYTRHAFAANTVLMSAGFVLVGYQIAGLFWGQS